MTGPRGHVKAWPLTSVWDCALLAPQLPGAPEAFVWLLSSLLLPLLCPPPFLPHSLWCWGSFPGSRSESVSQGTRIGTDTDMIIWYKFKVPCKDLFQFSSVAQSCPTLQPHELQHARPPCSSPTPGVYSNSCPLSRWCHPAISSSVVPFSSCPQSLPASGSFPMSQLFTEVAKVMEFQLQHQSFQWTPRTDLL